MNIDRIGAEVIAKVSSTIVLYAISVLLIVPGMVWARTWRTRRTLLEMESLRPVCRSRFADQVAAAIAWDLVPALITHAVALCIIMILAVPEENSAAWLADLLILFVSLCAMTFAMCLWSIVIRLDWIWFLVELALCSPLIVVLLVHLYGGEAHAGICS